jgi:cyclase
MTIQRRDFIKSTGLALGAASVAKINFLNLLFEQDAFKMTALRNNVGIFEERGGTIAWMVSNNGIVVVDTQFPDQAGHLIGEIKKKQTREIDLLINTHHHGDHTAGNIAFKGLVKNHVAHENAVKNMKSRAEASDSMDKVLLPVQNFKKNLSLNVGDEKMSMDYFGAAHTDGDAIIHFENANIAHMGDLLFNRRVPYIDKSAGANIANWQVVLEEAQKHYDNDTLFVYGHAGEGYEIQGGKADLAAFQNYLGKVLEFVKKGVDAGKTKEELAKTESIPGAEAFKGNQTRAVNAAWTEIVEGK